MSVTPKSVVVLAAKIVRDDQDVDISCPGGASDFAFLWVAAFLASIKNRQ
jgi:hypothetical protein